MEILNIFFIDNIFEVMNDKKIIVLVFLDFFKVFDSINYEKLLEKFLIVGVLFFIVEWFRSYLLNCC